jgi:L-fuconolactonase
MQYTWQAALPQLNKTWTVGDLVQASLLSPLQPTEVVFIEVSAVEADWINEMHYIQSLAVDQRHGEPVIRAIIGHVALQAGATVGPLLDRLQKEVPLFRGVRQGESSAFLTNDTFVRGICELGQRNLEFDVLANPSLFPQVAELAKRCPQTRLVLDHMGSPAIFNGSAGYSIWAAAIQQLAQQPNIYVKISGAPSEAAHGSVGNWTVDEIEPFVRHSIELFGWERALFAGNWFFLRLGGTYESWGNAVATILGRMAATQAQREMLFFSTARKAYNIQA